MLVIICLFEVDSDHKYCQTFKSLELNIKDYIEEYNYNRYQWTLKKMAPIEYWNHLLSA
ncbi:IS3 family transposase [Bacillus sp. D-CC]